MMATTRRLAALIVFAATLSGFGVEAQDYPSRLVRFVVPYPAGGGVDGLARPIADRLSQLWRQPVVIENKPGASTMIGGQAVAQSPPDGYTLLFTSESTITSNPHLFRKAPYDPLTELAPVTQLLDLHQMVVAHPSVSANTLKELVALSKSAPDTLNYGSYGNGSQPHLLFGMLNKLARIDIKHVPYRGIAPALTGTVAGDVQLTLGGAGTTGAFFASGQLKPLATGRKERLKSHPNVPTLAEAGFPELDPQSWFGLFAPAGTARHILEKIQADVAAVIKDPEFSARYVEGLGYTTVGSTPDEFAAFIKTDLEHKRRMIEAAEVRIE